MLAYHLLLEFSFFKAACLAWLELCAAIFLYLPFEAIAENEDVILLI